MSNSTKPKGFTHLLPQDPSPSLIVDAQAGLLAANPAASTLLATQTADYIEVLPVNAVALIKSALGQNRVIDQVESRVGSIILLWCFIPDADTQQVLIRGRDATADIHTHEEAIRSSRLYRLITENTTDLISRHAPDGRFIDATPASWRLLGYWPEELRGKRLDEIFTGHQTVNLYTETRQKLRDDGYSTLTLEVTHKNGARRWLEIASRAIRETYTGAVVEVISVSRDITSRIESEEQNRLLADELAHTARLATMGELASSIAHEMNQPLASIVNFASASQRFLKNRDQQPEQLSKVDDGLQKIIHHANRASEVIKRLRAFLRKGKKSMGPVALNTVITEVTRLCQWEADKHGVKVRKQLAQEGPVITADPILLEQVLINLIRNGIEANVDACRSQQDAKPLQILVSTLINDQNETLIVVTDEGPGLDEKGIRQMFQPFYTSKPTGLGLGLSMSRSIIEGFGGFLDAVPAETGGLSLICRFPNTHSINITNNPEPLDA
ncbi:PAS domain S-box protein [Marinobacter sp.]|uniref:sensor histidine kinase n=1 Tax=Marinobacter sp. TaxID=50741 RepID=UPI002B277A21|nr:PAS domain S-box protein [Marinobacter sp.]